MMGKSTTALRSKDNEKWNASKMFLPFLIFNFQSSVFFIHDNDQTDWCRG